MFVKGTSPRIFLPIYTNSIGALYKTLSPTFRTELASLITKDFKLMQFENALEPIVSTFDSMTIDSSAVQLSNASGSIFFTEFPISMRFNPCHPRNKYELIPETQSGTMISVTSWPSTYRY